MLRSQCSIVLVVGLLGLTIPPGSALATGVVPRTGTTSPDSTRGDSSGAGWRELARRSRRAGYRRWLGGPDNRRALWASPAGAPPSEAGAATTRGLEADPSLFGADGNVVSMARSGSTLYIAGSFRSVGENSGGFVPVDGRTGQTVRPFPKVAGSVYAMAPDGAGGWYIGGEFTAVAGKPRSCVAQVRADGSVSEWNPGVTGSPGYITPPAVLTLAVHANRVYVGGDFTQIGGVQRRGLGCVDAYTGAVVDWSAVISDAGYVVALAIQGDSLFVGGGFSSLGGQPRSSLAAVSTTTGEVLPWRVDVFGGAYALLMRGDTLLVAGDFLSIAGQPRQLLAAVDIRTAKLLPIDFRVSGITLDYVWAPQVDALALVGDTLYAAGNFTRIGGQIRAGIAALSFELGDALPWMPDTLGPRYAGYPPPLCTAIAVQGGQVYLAGSIHEA